jgi:hypothetical protein
MVLTISREPVWFNIVFTSCLMPSVSPNGRLDGFVRSMIKFTFADSLQIQLILTTDIYLFLYKVNVFPAAHIFFNVQLRTFLENSPECPGQTCIVLASSVSFIMVIQAPLVSSAPVRHASPASLAMVKHHLNFGSRQSLKRNHQ